jgi:hypothetical protein
MTLRRLPTWKRALLAVWPPYRRRYERNFRAGIKYLMEHPEASVRFE